MFRKLLLIAAALLPAAACLPLQARTLVDIDVIDRDSGRVLPEYRHRGDLFVPGEPGRRYAVRLSNRTAQRVLVVLSVDGVNAVSGQTASPSQAGYVLSPWESAEISGWRKSLDDVAQFYFTDLPDSYAARTGRPDDVGVIGIAVFQERMRPLPRPLRGPPVAAEAEQGRRAERKLGSAAPAAEASASADGIATQGLGTGHGEREWAPVGQTTFERATSRPAQVTQLRYEDGRTLVALGIAPRGPWNDWRDRDEERRPRAFPDGFVADPPGW